MTAWLTNQLNKEPSNW